MFSWFVFACDVFDARCGLETGNCRGVPAMFFSFYGILRCGVFGWLVGWLVGCLQGCLVGLSVGCLGGWVGRSVCRSEIGKKNKELISN